MDPQKAAGVQGGPMVPPLPTLDASFFFRMRTPRIQQLSESSTAGHPPVWFFMFLAEIQNDGNTECNFIDFERLKTMQSDSA